MVPASSPKAVAMVVSPTGPPFELIDNRTKYLIVYLIQSVLVNVKRLE